MGRNVILVNNTVLLREVVKRADLICFHNQKKKKRENRNGNDGR